MVICATYPIAGLLHFGFETAQAFAPSTGKVIVDTLILDEASKIAAQRTGIPLPIVLEVVEREIKPKFENARGKIDELSGAK